MVSFYAFPVIFIDTVLFKKGTLIKRAGVQTPWTPPPPGRNFFCEHCPTEDYFKKNGKCIRNYSVIYCCNAPHCTRLYMANVILTPGTYSTWKSLNLISAISTSMPYTCNSAIGVIIFLGISRKILEKIRNVIFVPEKTHNPEALHCKLVGPSADSNYALTDSNVVLATDKLQSI